jgi:hypothetical protein
MKSIGFIYKEDSLPDDLKYEEVEEIDLEQELTQILTKNNRGDFNVL